MNTSLQLYNATLAPPMCPLWPPAGLSFDDNPLDNIAPKPPVTEMNCGISNIDILSHLFRHVFTLPCTFKNGPYDCSGALAIGLVLESIKNIEILPTSPFGPIKIFVKSIFSDLRRMQFELTAVSCYKGNKYLCVTGIVTGAFINRDLIRIVIQNGIEWHHRKGCKVFYSNFGVN